MERLAIVPLIIAFPVFDLCYAKYVMYKGIKLKVGCF